FSTITRPPTSTLFPYTTLFRSVDRKFECAEMAARVADGALENGKLVDPARDHVGGSCQQHGDVEAVGETLCSLDGNLVAAIDQHDAAALERHQRDWRHLFARRGNQGC